MKRKEQKRGQFRVVYAGEKYAYFVRREVKPHTFIADVGADGIVRVRRSKSLKSF